MSAACSAHWTAALDDARIGAQFNLPGSAIVGFDRDERRCDGRDGAAYGATVAWAAEVALRGLRLCCRNQQERKGGGYEGFEFHEVLSQRKTHPDAIWTHRNWYDEGWYTLRQCTT